MFSHSDQNHQDSSTVFSSLNIMRAQVVCSHLEAAGLPARLAPQTSGHSLHKAGEEFRVEVPGDFLHQAEALLHPASHPGEIYLYQG